MKNSGKITASPAYALVCRGLNLGEDKYSFLFGKRYRRKRGGLSPTNDSIDAGRCFIQIFQKIFIIWKLKTECAKITATKFL